MIIGDCTDIISGFAFKSKQFNSEGKGTPLVRIRDVGKNNCETFFEGEYKEEYVLNNGDFLVAMDGEFRLAEWSGGKALLNQRVCKIVPKEEKVHNRYLLYMLPKELKRIEDTTSYVTVKHLSVKKIKSIDIPLPPLETQKKIASILDAADAYRQKTKALIAKYDELTQSLFLEMFGDPVTNPKGWEKKSFTEIFDVNTGKLDSNKAVVNGEYPFFTCSKQISWIDIYDFDQEALLLAGNNAAGVYDVKYYNGKFNAYQRTYVLSLKDDENYHFYRFHLQQKLKELQNVSIGSGTKYLTIKILSRLMLLCPDLESQKLFKKRVDQIEAQKAQVQESLEKAEELFNSLLQRAFKGKIK